MPKMCDECRSVRIDRGCWTDGLRTNKGGKQVPKQVCTDCHYASMVKSGRLVRMPDGRYVTPGVTAGVGPEDAEMSKIANGLIATMLSAPSGDVLHAKSQAEAMDARMTEHMEREGTGTMIIDAIVQGEPREDWEMLLEAAIRVWAKHARNQVAWAIDHHDLQKARKAKSAAKQAQG